MKKSTFVILSLGVTLLIASCKKEDVAANASANKASTSVSNTAQWKSLSWSSSKDENITTYFDFSQSRILGMDKTIKTIVLSQSISCT